MKKTIICVLLVVCMFSAFAEIPEPHVLYQTVDLAYYPKAARIPRLTAEPGFAPTTEAMAALEARTTLFYRYKIPVPFSDNPLVKGNTLDLGASFELSPVSVMPEISVSFTPIAFLVLSMGVNTAVGWDLKLGPLDVQGLAVYNPSTKSYDSVKPFGGALYRPWFEGLFQFDVAALVPGDWNHVVMQAKYRASYTGMTAAKKGQPYVWQGVGNYVNGWRYEASVLLGYQMPLVLQMVALMAEFDGYFDKNAIAPEYQAWNPIFTTTYLSTVFNFQLTKKQSLLLQIRLGTRRSFTEEIHTLQSELDKTSKGFEWYFNRIALSYTINY